MTATVLIVEDEAAYAEAYAKWLPLEHEVRIETTVETAIEALDPSIDVVILDRRLPDGSGSDVAGAIEERNLTCRVAMLTAVDPDFDVVDLAIQEYLVKPVSKEEFQSLVDRLVKLATYDEQVQEVYALTRKKAALEATKSQREREASRVFTTLEHRLDTAIQQADETFEELAQELGFDNLYNELQSSRP